MIRHSLSRLLMVHVVCLAASTAFAFPDAGLRFRDDAGLVQSKALQQSFARLGVDRSADAPAQALGLSDQVIRVIGLLDLSKPAIPKSGAVCSQILGPWYSLGPVLTDTNAASVDKRTWTEA